jgi:hypothetical protein
VDDVGKFPESGPEIRNIFDRPFVKGRIFFKILIVPFIDKIHETVHVRLLNFFFGGFPQ